MKAFVCTTTILAMTFFIFCGLYFNAKKAEKKYETVYDCIKKNTENSKTEIAAKIAINECKDRFRDILKRYNLISMNITDDMLSNIKFDFYTENKCETTVIVTNNNDNLMLTYLNIGCGAHNNQEFYEIVPPGRGVQVKMIDCGFEKSCWHVISARGAQIE